MKNNNYEVSLTFKTDKVTSEVLKIIAHKLNKTQPELINEICITFITSMLNDDIEETERPGP